MASLHVSRPPMDPYRMKMDPAAHRTPASSLAKKRAVGRSKPPVPGTAAWMEWVENCGMDMFACEDDCRVAVNSCTKQTTTNNASSSTENRPRKSSPQQHEDSRASSSLMDDPYAHYAALHDEFLESLLYEQTVLKQAAAIEQSRSFNSNTTITSNSSSIDDSDASAFLPANRKRRRPLHIKVKENYPPGNISSSELSGSIQHGHQNPITYLHPDCRMQKDKGKGEPVGSNICAHGAEACLAKMRVKMDLLTEVASADNEKQQAASMKRRKAKMFSNSDVVETRSLLELKMGFLSMQYGILLRWNTEAKVVFVVLRKMCHESFYPKQSQKLGWLSSFPPSSAVPVAQPSSPPQPRSQSAPVPPLTSTNSSARKEAGAHRSLSVQPTIRRVKVHPFSVLQDMVADRHAVLQRADGMEVTLVDPPYRIPRPASFPPPSLTVTVKHATGLAKRSDWTVQLSTGTHMASNSLTWDPVKGLFVVKRGEDACHKFSGADPQDVVWPSAVELCLMEHRQRRKQGRRLSSHTVPLHTVPASAKATRVTIPVSDDACVSLDVVWQSDYCAWLNQEMQARLAEETVSSSPFSDMTNIRRKKTPPVVEEDDDDSWDWICHLC